MKKLRNAVLQFSVFLPTTVFAAAGGSIPTGSTTINAFFVEFCKISNWIFAFALAAAVIAIIFSGVSFYASGGSEQKVSQAKKFLQWALVGVAVAILSKSFIAIIGSFVGISSSTPISTFLCV